MTPARDLADRFHQRWLGENPFVATSFGIPGYDDLVPDESEEGEQAWRAEVGRFLREVGAIERGPLTPADAVTLDCTKEAAAQELAAIDMAPAEHTVTAMQYAGPATFMALAARTVLIDPAAAEAYLARLRRSGSSPGCSCSPTCPPSSVSAASPCSPRAGACTPSSSPRKPGCTPTTGHCSVRSARR